MFNPNLTNFSNQASTNSISTDSNLLNQIMPNDSPDEIEFTFDFFYEYNDWGCRY